MAETKSDGPTNVALIREYFFQGDTKSATREIKLLSTEERAQLGEGIRNGSLTY